MSWKHSPCLDAALRRIPCLHVTPTALGRCPITRTCTTAHKEQRMLVSTRNQVSDPHAVPASENGDAESHKTIAVLTELLGHSIDLRDLYKNARWQTADIQHRRLRQ